ncbi:hypothetical protein [Rhizobium sp. LjRoot254]|uniref:hypothetical protein n=1 Tax=Rhizobium sp. LjRoot254 TaxID=3342297 RepID=UPI003ECE9BAB
MTNDPSTNYFLAQITSPLVNKDAELVRALLVSVLAVRGCDGITIDQKAQQRFLAENGFFALKGKRWSDAEFQARNSLRGTTDREIAHLCSGIEYLFGKNGVMGPGLFKIGVAKPNHYDPANPYFHLPTLPEPPL